MIFDPGAAAELFAKPLPAAVIPPKRPAAIAVSAAVLAVFACLELLSMVGFLIGGGPDGPLFGGPLRAFFEHFALISVARGSVDVLALAAASAIWSGRPWGRVAGIAVSAWWATVFSAFGVAFALSLPDGMVASLPAVFVGMWRGAAIATGLFWGAVLSTPAVILTRRSAAVWFDAKA